MGKKPDNALQIAVRWCARAMNALGHATLFCGVSLWIANRLAPPGKARCRLARKFECQGSMVPHVIVCYTAIYMLKGLIILLCLWGAILIFSE